MRFEHTLSKGSGSSYSGFKHMADHRSVGCVCTKVHWALVWSQASADGVALYISALPESAGTKKRRCLVK